jgi:AraC-like DNA-binding protein
MLESSSDDPGTPTGGSRAESYALALELDDPDLAAALFPIWEMRFCQIGRGAIAISARYLALPGLAIRWGRANRVVQLCGVPLRPEYNFTPIGEHNAGWRWRGRTIAAGHLEVLGPGDAIDHVSSDPGEADALSVEEETLRDAVRTLLRRELEDVMPREIALAVPTQALGLLRAEMHRALDLGWADPESLRVAESLRSRCLDALCRILESSDRSAGIVDPAGNRLEVAREAAQLIEQGLAHSVSTLSLCRALNVSRRTLFYAFRDAYGMTPMAFSKIKRLNRVRHELKASDPATTTIRAVALRWGFAHGGQFARDYQIQFGESPSRTLFERGYRSRRWRRRDG